MFGNGIWLSADAGRRCARAGHDWSGTGSEELTPSVESCLRCSAVRPQLPTGRCPFGDHPMRYHYGWTGTDFMVHPVGRCRGLAEAELVSVASAVTTVPQPRASLDDSPGWFISG